MVVLCVFITLKPGSRKAEEEEKKEKIFSPNWSALPSPAPLFFLSLLFPVPTVSGEIKTPPSLSLSLHRSRQVWADPILHALSCKRKYTDSPSVIISH
jgi:hypothetical protein